MTYFQLYPHCYLVIGSLNHAIFDILQNRVFWLKGSPYREAICGLENGQSLEEICRSNPENLPKIQDLLKLLEKMDYGSYQHHPFYPEKYRPYILPGQEEKFLIPRQLGRIIVEISSSCSLQCSMCGFQNGWANCLCACGIWRSPKENQTFDISRLIAELSALGCKQVYIQGGDPFLERASLKTLVTTALSKKITVLIQTPGITLTGDDWKFIRETGSGLVMPVFGAEEDIHDLISGTPGSFRAFKEVVHESRKNGVSNLRSRIILTKDNVLHQEKIKAWLMNYGIQWVSVDVFFDYNDFTTRNEEWKNYLFKLFNREPSDFRVPRELFFRLAKGHECWQDGLAITRSGKVLPCIASRHHILGDVNKESLLDIFRLKRHTFFRDGGKDSFAPCRECEFRYGCSSCSLITENMFGTWQRRSWNCLYNPHLGEWGSGSNARKISPVDD